jgi:F-type H+-transporting ATPase subunit alpha
MDVDKQVLLIWAGTKGYLDDIALEDVKKFEEGLLRFVENSRGSLLEKVRTKKVIDTDMEAELKAAAGEFRDRFKADAETAASAGR